MPPRTRPWASDGRFRVRMGQGERKVAFVGMRKATGKGSRNCLNWWYTGNAHARGQRGYLYYL